MPRPGPTPQQLFIGKRVLLLVHVLAIAAAVLPFTSGRRPIATVQYILAFPRWPATVIGLLAAPLLLPVVLAALQARSLGSSSISRGERIAVGIVAAIASACVVVGFGLATKEFLRDQETWKRILSALMLAVGWMPILAAAAILVVGRDREFPPVILLAFWIRAGYCIAAGVGTSVFLFSLNVGGWLSAAAVALYGVEAVSILMLGHPKRAQRVTRRWLGLWLPAGDARGVGDRDLPTCEHCGYDLRGVIAGGVITCPECGGSTIVPDRTAAPPVL